LVFGANWMLLDKQLLVCAKQPSADGQKLEVCRPAEDEDR
jgi:hypothetical protein